MRISAIKDGDLYSMLRFLMFAEVGKVELRYLSGLGL
jgi:hypothetical protein